MVSLLVFFYIFVFIFGIIGAARGWAKEMLVIFSIILALALIAVVEELLPFTRNLLAGATLSLFWFRTDRAAAQFFGYQTPRQALLRPTKRRGDP
jgi:xanthosine utilization system XapX-like protein